MSCGIGAPGPTRSISIAAWARSTRPRSSSPTSSAAAFFFTPPQIAESVPHAWLFLSTWVVAGGLLAFAGAMAYAELSPGEH